MTFLVNTLLLVGMVRIRSLVRYIIFPAWLES